MASLPDNVMTLLLVLDGMRQKAFWRLRTGPINRWRFSGSPPDSLLVAPQDIRPADFHLANEIYLGNFLFAGQTVVCQEHSPFLAEDVPPAWVEELHAFGWLRHLKVAGSDLSRSNAQAHVADWIEHIGSDFSHPGWEPGTTAARVQSWLCHSPMLVEGLSEASYRSMLKSLGRQVRFLRRVMSKVPDGLTRLRVAIAIAYASICTPMKDRAIRQAARDLEQELEQQILPDGGHMSRNPVVILELLADLLPLRQTYVRQNQPVPAELVKAIDRMIPALRFYRHADGNLAQFNGTGATPAALLATVLRYDDTRGKAPQNAVYSGFQRLARANTALIADMGRYPSRRSARDAHAGCLSFELSSGRNRFIVNCGVPGPRYHAYRQIARATAAHSTATMNDTSSCRFLPDTWYGRFLSSPLVSGPSRVEIDRQDDESAVQLAGSHDGYVDEFGLLHTRFLELSGDGVVLNGADRFEPEESTGEKKKSGGAGQKPAKPVDVAIRFHLHPDIKASPLANGYSILLAAPDREVWTFSCVDVAIGLEESIFLSGPAGPRRCEQIVLRMEVLDRAEIRWTLTKSEPPRRSGRRQEEESRYPDLLEALRDDARPLTDA